MFDCCRFDAPGRAIPAGLARSPFLSPAEILRGSLLHRTIRHSAGCAVCARGKGHRVGVLTISYPGGRTKHLSLSPEQRQPYREPALGQAPSRTQLLALALLVCLDPGSPNVSNFGQKPA